MTISTTTNRVRTAGDGSTTAFSFPYYFEADAHLAVYLTDAAGTETLQTISTHYTVSGAGAGGGGTVTFVTAPATTETVTIIRNEPLTQNTDANDVGTFREQAFESQFDRHARQVQRLFEMAGRALKFRKSSANTDIDFPEPIAGLIPGWNSDATGLENKAVADVGESFPAVALNFFRRNSGNTAFEARTPAQVRGDLDIGIVSGHRNKVINGDCEIAQRGVSFVISAGGAAITLDRWRIVNGTDQAVTITQESHTVGQVLVPGEPEFFMRATFSTAPTTGSLYFTQRVEGARTLANSEATQRFYIATSAASVYLHVYLAQVFGYSGASSSVGIANFSETINATSFTKKIGTVSVPSISGKTITDGNYLEVVAELHPRHAATYDISRFSLVEGDATDEDKPPAPRDITLELALCQRFARAISTDALNEVIAPNATEAYLNVGFSPPMRGVPNVSLVGSGGMAFSDNFSADVFNLSPSIVGSQATSSGARVHIGGFSGLTTGRNYPGLPSSTHNTQLLFSAEI
ncbi:hypothetical protein [Hoeflea sp. TYP-13]|uniref:hypothetical protein n=1 Tax=Hoeflea sp. TYP-13 TaxID=3230023 RepID=UPI0034C6639B